MKYVINHDPVVGVVQKEKERKPKNYATQVMNKIYQNIAVTRKTNLSIRFNGFLKSSYFLLFALPLVSLTKVCL